MGGSEKACVRMANALCDRYKVTICTYFDNGELKKELDPRIEVKAVFPKFVRGAARLAHIPPKLAYRCFVRGCYDIEIAVGDGLESHIISGSPNPNKYSWIHINLGNSGTRYSEKAVQKYRAFKKIICVSEVNKNAFVSEMGDEYDIAVAYTPISRKEIIEKAGNIEKRKKNSFICVGRLETVKGFDNLIIAAEKLRDKEFEIHIYGDGTQREYLGNLIQEKNLQNKVFLEGMSSNPYPEIKRADALICPSRNESFGFSVVEAMILRTPVISTRCGGTEEIIENPEQGILCENSVDGLVHGMKQFMEGTYKVDIQKAYEKACIFDLDQCVDAFCNVIEDKE